MIIKKSREEIEKMAQAGDILVATLALLEGKVRPGISTAELDSVAEPSSAQRGAAPTF